MKGTNVRPLQINLALLFLPTQCGRGVINYINALQNFSHCICNIMPFVATVAFVMDQKVHLSLDDIAVVATEGGERCLGGPQMHRTSFRFSELHKSHFLHGSNCVIHITRIMKKKTRAEDQKLKTNLKWPTFTKGRKVKCFGNAGCKGRATSVGKVVGVTCTQHNHPPWQIRH